MSIVAWSGDTQEGCSWAGAGSTSSEQRKTRMQKILRWFPRVQYVYHFSDHVNVTVTYCDHVNLCQTMSSHVKSCQFMSNCHTVSLISIEIWISVGNLDEKCASSQAVFPESLSLSLRISRHLSQAHFILNLLISVEICWYLLILKWCWFSKRCWFSSCAGSSSSVARPNLARLLRSILACQLGLSGSAESYFALTGDKGDH